MRKVGGGEAVSVYKGPSAEDVMQTVKGAAMDLIGTESLDGDTPLMEAGLDSLAGLTWLAWSAWLGLWDNKLGGGVGSRLNHC